VNVAGALVVAVGALVVAAGALVVVAGADVVVDDEAEADEVEEPLGQNVTVMEIVSGHEWVLESSVGYKYASEQVSDSHVTVVQAETDELLSGEIEMAVLYPDLPVSSLHAS